MPTERSITETALQATQRLRKDYNDLWADKARLQSSYDFLAGDQGRMERVARERDEEIAALRKLVVDMTNEMLGEDQASRVLGHPLLWRERPDTWQYRAGRVRGGLDIREKTS